ncbi:hypothetical protein FQA47_012311 [Oryzias melastigma]|uniref:Uncharacterized protein n=1 Tax=Oryzias melastigma TaxID=30732 RepID=A0A834FB36_ORYME|nr:hypothetical protein FQA47_012311 [Oryzias melastigma]
MIEDVCIFLQYRNPSCPRRRGAGQSCRALTLHPPRPSHPETCARALREPAERRPAPAAHLSVTPGGTTLWTEPLTVLQEPLRLGWPRFRIPGAVVRTAGKELRTMVSEKNRFLRLFHPRTAGVYYSPRRRRGATAEPDPGDRRCRCSSVRGKPQSRC